ncbi:MAG: hypothetical protein PQ612_05095 [Rickettsiales bacterium]|nr:hypothetical protein [Pseudomonadota bacterium]MDA0966395.1 hypothetical protein [Pseudomonadota bacterium]MDG4543257.1 hypothetical protein [Rickettsiales bacterium]MDG4545523.1 hypothetical protein [Rickettsiales bacterium]MDG4547972.1 hypothetical protein [Rickettsiales bacterium]
MSKEKDGDSGKTTIEDLGYGEATPDTAQRNAGREGTRRFQRRGATAGVSQGTVEIRKRTSDQYAAIDQLADTLGESGIEEPSAKRRKTDSGYKMDIDPPEHEEVKRSWKKREDDRDKNGPGKGLSVS